MDNRVFNIIERTKDIYNKNFNISKKDATELLMHLKEFDKGLRKSIRYNNIKSNSILKKGDEISHFYFIRKTKTGCPIIEKRYIGIKGITLIEVTNVGKSYISEGHIKRVRITGLKEDGKTEYQRYFNDVYTDLNSEELKIKYIDAMNKHMAKLSAEENRLYHVRKMHDAIIIKNLNALGITNKAE